MYHYVREGSHQLPFFRYLSIENFCRQLDYFEQQYGFVKMEDIVNCFILKKDNSYQTIHNKVLLTFDDGVIDHYSYVYPELLKRGIVGLFFVSTGVFDSNKALDVHRIHYCLGRMGGGACMRLLNKIITDDMLEYDYDIKSNIYTKQKNDEATKEFKSVMNYFLKYEYREAVLDLIVKEIGIADQDLFKELYMSMDNMQEMQKNGMIFGSHSVKHCVMSKLSRDEQEKEIRNSFLFLERNLDMRKLKIFCYPYGGFHTFNEDTYEALKENNAMFAFNVESRDIEYKDILQNPYTLPRYDCNEFEFGQASLGVC
ncbi:polysaccharide deacetylase [Helicobacter canadensis MIT 98-5491]|nr:polysaccharide deacetylase [Helicobacter canadensis MIT 98-5491]